MNGKGDKPRPIKDRKEYYKNWDNINWKGNKIKKNAGKKDR